MTPTTFQALVREHLKQNDMPSLKDLLTNANEVDILDTMLELPAKHQVIVYRLLPKDKALFVFEQLDTDDQLALIHSFTDEAAIEAIEELTPDDRVRLLDELPATVAKKMIAALSPQERQMTNLLMGYEAQTAGRIMTPEYVRISRDMTAAEALEKVKHNAKDKETIYTLYITDHARKLEGALSLRGLLIADPNEKIEDIMKDVSASVSTDTDQEEVARLLQKLDWLAVPVVDKENRLVGIITVDDAMDILEEEATEDMFTQAGILAKKEANRSEVLISGSLLSIWKVRLPFLFITLVAGVLAGFVIEGFEDVLESIAAVAIFIPLIMDMGGNVGTQSSTVFARGVVLGHVNVSHFFKHFIKEVGIGFSLGVVVGILSGAVATIWQGEVMLGLAVGLSLVITMTLAALLGFLVPFLLIKLGIDQAAGSAPIITSIKDIAGLLIYFVSVSIFLSHLL
ncbi:MAG: magnesium transporter [Oscillospiraceae bacterium]|nr:magnesium transporter [Oscillospiraceae bacterium]